MDHVLDCLYSDTKKLEDSLSEIKALTDKKQQGELFSTVILQLMENVRKDADVLEGLIPADEWPFPSYTDLLFHE